MRRAGPFLAMLAVGCASSPYDRAWVGQSIESATGHAPREGKIAAPTVPPGVRDIGALSADDAVAVALWNSSRFQVELARLGFSRADLADAGALPNPTLALLLPIGPRQLEASATYPVAALLQRPYRVAAAKADVERTARALVEVGLDLARDVRLAHADAILSARRLVVRQEVEQTVAVISKLTEARLRAGDASQLEARAAQAEAFVTVDGTKRATIDVQTAHERVRRLVGLAHSALGDRMAFATATTDLRPPASTGVLVEAALAARPDIRASEIAFEAAGARLGWEKSKIAQVFARVDLKPVGTRGGAPSYFLPGAQVDIPIFNWNPGGRGRAEAEMTQAAFRYLSVRDDVAADVRIAHDQLEQAIGSLTPWRENVLPLLAANVTTAVKAYEVGGETFLVVLDATRRAQEARLREIDLEADVWRARAALDRAVGRRLP